MDPFAKRENQIREHADLIAKIRQRLDWWSEEVVEIEAVNRWIESDIVSDQEREQLMTPSLQKLGRIRRQAIDDIAHLLNERAKAQGC
jgi:hypothetical protein